MTPSQINEVVDKSKTLTQQVSNGTKDPGTNPVPSPAPSEAVAQTSAPGSSSPSASDILKRSNELKGQSKPQSPSPDPSIEELRSLSKQDIDKIKDPIARDIVSKKWELLEKGFNEKFQQLAATRKELESKLSQSQAPQAWTPERLQSELAKHDFVSSIQYLQQQAAPQGWGGTSEEWSTLSDKEKQEFMALRQDNVQIKSQLNQFLKSQEDEKLLGKYPSYSAPLVDGLIQDIYSGKYQMSREDIWRAASYEEAVTSAYELGKKDASTRTQERINGSTIIDGNTMKPANSLPEGVNKKDFVDIAKYRLSQLMHQKRQ